MNEVVNGIVKVFLLKNFLFLYILNSLFYADFEKNVLRKDNRVFFEL